MKVLMVNVLYPPTDIGGAERSVALLAEALVARGIEVVVATLQSDAPAMVETVSGVRVHRLPIDNIYWPYDTRSDRPSAWRRLAWHIRNRWNRRAAERVGRLIAAERPDLVHCNVLTGFSAAIWAEASRHGVPVVQTLRDYSLLCVRASLFRKGQTCRTRCVRCRLLTAPARAASGIPVRVVTNSDYVAERHRREGYFPGTPVTRIFSIAEPLSLPPPTPAGTVTFGFAGRLEREKGIEHLLEATTNLRSQGWRLLVAGRGDPGYVADLRRRYASPRITWMGFADPRDFYNEIATLVIPSIWPEPLPRTLIEAICNGIPVICSDAGGIPEVARLSSQLKIYAGQDIPALVQAMETAIADPVAWTRGTPAAAAVAQFSADTIAGEYIRVYRDAIGRAASAGQSAPASGR